MAEAELEPIEIDLSLEPIFGTPVNGTKENDSILIYIIPSDMSVPEDLKFQYSIVDQSTEAMNIQLQFVSPGYVSTSTDPDQLVLILNDFRDSENNLIVER